MRCLALSKIVYVIIKEETTDNFIFNLKSKVPLKGQCHQILQIILRSKMLNVSFLFDL